MMIYSAIFFFVGFYILVKGANWLVDGASSLAKKFNISNFIIGLVVAGIGTSIPEFATFLTGHVAGESELALGTIVGSNTFNILFILGFSSLIVPLAFRPTWVRNDLVWNMIAVAAPLALFLISGNRVITRWGGVALFALFVFWLLTVIKKSNDIAPDDDDKLIRIFIVPIAVGLVCVGLLGVILGGKWVVDGGVAIARWFGVHERLVGLTLVGIGTSLPEFTVTFVAALKLQPGIAVGNIIGSNIFDFLMILGVGAIVKPITFSPGISIDTIITLSATMLLYLFVRFGEYGILKRRHGLCMVLAYGAYLVYIFMSGGA
jgi:cation:H+ antiporter